MKRYISLIAALLACVAGMAAQPEGSFSKIERTYTLEKDGSSTYNYVKVLTINTHNALNNLYGETFITYDPAWQSLKINHCYTIQADGNRIDAPANAFNEVLPKPAADAPAYNGLRELVVTHTGLEIGATIYLDYTIAAKAGYTGGLDATVRMGETSPVKESRLTVVIPSDRELQYASTGKVQMKRSENGSSKSYVWTARNIPAEAVFEPSQPYYGSLTPAIAFTTLSAGDILASNVPTKGGELTAKAVAAATANTSDDKVFAIRRYVASNLAACALSAEAAGWRARTPEEVLASAYGTQLEKCALLCAMLDKAGVKASIIAIRPAQLAAVKALSNVAEYKVLAGGKLLSAERTSDASNAIYAGRYVATGLDGEEVALDAATAESTCKAKAVITKEQITFDGTLTLNSAALPVATEQEVKSSAAGAVKAFGAASKTESQLTADGCKVEFESAKKLAANHGYAVISLPSPAAIALPGMMNSARRSTYEHPCPMKSAVEYEIELGDGVKLLSKPFRTALKNNAGSVTLTMENNGGKVTLRREIELPRNIISAADYSSLRELVNLWNNNAYTELMVKAE